MPHDEPLPGMSDAVDRAREIRAMSIADATRDLLGDAELLLRIDAEDAKAFDRSLRSLEQAIRHYRKVSS